MNVVCDMTDTLETLHTKLREAERCVLDTVYRSGGNPHTYKVYLCIEMRPDVHALFVRQLRDTLSFRAFVYERMLFGWPVSITRPLQPSYMERGWLPTHGLNRNVSV